ncbi:gag-polypeptide of LTR copia-type [Sesbania bispinosa]|nr:gag-polypeptide of LTR copia-type [Sesbania bispinosa]
MENFLRSKEMWHLVKDGIPTLGTTPTEAQRKSVEEAKLKDLKVKNFLFQAIDREILETILDKGTSKTIWRSMQQKYQGSTKVKRAQLQALRREFELLTMKEGQTVDSYLGRTLNVVNKMKSNGEAMEQKESNDLGTLSIDELHGNLLVHEQRMQGFQTEEHVLKITNDDRPIRGRGGRGPFRGGRGRGRGRRPIYAELEEEEEVVLVAYEELHQTVQEEAWFLDSGCSNHMTGNKEWFSEMEEGFCRTVKLGNGTTMAVVAKGSIRVQINGITQVHPQAVQVRSGHQQMKKMMVNKNFQFKGGQQGIEENQFG